MDLKFKDNNKLSFGYVQLEYIESTGTQYIDTGVKANQSTRVVLDCILLASTGDGYLFGGRDEWQTNWFGIEASSVTNSFYGNQYGSISISRNVRHIIDCDKNIVKLDNNTIKTWIVQTWQASTNLIINSLANNGDESYQKLGKNRFYNVKIYNGDTLIRDFIPCITDFGTPGMYDTVSGTFFYNQGTGDFVAGPVVKSSLPESILLKTTTLYHKNTPNVDGLQLLNGILDYQKTHQDEIKEYYYPTTQLWQDIITEYPDILYYYNINHKFCIPFCEADDPEQYAEDFLGAVDDIQQYLEDYPDLIPIIAENPSIAPIIAENPSIAPIIAENPSIAPIIMEWNPIIHSLIDTGYENWIANNKDAYIITNYLISYKTKVDIIFNALENSASTHICTIRNGTNNSNSNKALGIAIDGSKKILLGAVPYNGTLGYTDSKISGEQIIETEFDYYNHNISIYNNSHQQLYTLNLSSVFEGIAEYPLALFGNNTMGTVSEITNSKIKKCDIYDAGNKVLSLVPFYRNGHYGMIDLITTTFYPNAGSGEFTYSLEPKNA